MESSAMRRTDIGSASSAEVPKVARPSSSTGPRKTRLPAGGKATPVTYRGRDGRQYVVIAAGGDGQLFGHSDEIVAFAIPR